MNKIVKKDVTPKNASSRKEAELTLDGECAHCGAKGFKVTLKFCDEDCKQAFLRANNIPSDASINDPLDQISKVK